MFSVFDSFTVTSNGGVFGHDLSPSPDPPVGSGPMTAVGFPSIPSSGSLANASGSGTALSPRGFSPTASFAVSVTTPGVIAPQTILVVVPVTSPAPSSSMTSEIVSFGAASDRARPVQALTDRTGSGGHSPSLEMTINKIQAPAPDRAIDRDDLRHERPPVSVEAAPIVTATRFLPGVWDDALHAYIAQGDEAAWPADAVAQPPDVAADPSASTLKSTLMTVAAVALWGTWEVQSRRDDHRRRRSYLRHIGL